MSCPIGTHQTHPLQPPLHPQVKVDEPLVKEEPQESYSEPEETKDTLQSADSDPSLTYSQHSGSLVGEAVAGSGGYTPQPLRPTNQPQTLEDLVALPGASGLQGVGVVPSSVCPFPTCCSFPSFVIYVIYVIGRCYHNFLVFIICVLVEVM